MKRRFKFLFFVITFSIFYIAIYAFASKGVEVAIIDTELCINCGECYDAQSMWVVENSGNGYPYWVHAEGGFEGLLYYYNPTESHKTVILEDIIPVCPANVFITDW